MTAGPEKDGACHYRELLEINRLITSSLDLSVVLSTITRQAAALLRAEAAALLLARDGVLMLAATYRLEGTTRAEIPLGPGVMTQIRDLGRDAGLATCVGVPLVLRDETIGVLATYRREPATAHSTEDEELLSALADQAAIAVENAQMYARLHAQTEALRESETRFRLAFDEAPIGVALVGTDGRFLRVNNVLCEMVGYSREELTGLSFQAITYPDDLNTDLTLRGKLARGEIPRYQLSKRYLRKDGAIVDIELSASVVRGLDGAPRYYIAQIEDVSDRKRAQEALRRSEAQLRALIENLPDGVFIHHGGPLVYANRALASLLGYADPAALARASLTDLYHPDDMPAVLDRLKTLATGKAASPRELRMLRQDGSICDIESTAIQVLFNDRPGFVVIVRDLAERKLAERERAQAYRRLRAVIELAPVGIMLSDDGRHWQENARATVAGPPHRCCRRRLGVRGSHPGYG